MSQLKLNGIPDVQERLNVGRSTVYELIASGELGSVKVGRRRLVTESQLVAFIEKLED